ncbi:hypothetical protein DPMN_080547 [Dreissena polymorpha]|uniref:Uncharacterized protein n=1 Tax=Dreissena polymorpha TaxID=45954 RepID=A0A9D3YR31_DREPO|nr:hypothetical protein DPMN_080547 [Dreissena polymorpha]
MHVNTFSFKAASRIVECQHKKQEHTIPAPASVTSVSSTSAAKAIFAPDSKRRRHGHANTGTMAVSSLNYYTQV